jgi:prolyl 4-hydroxylase
VQHNHPHVKNYQRMANVSFCQANDISSGMLDFRIPVKYLPVLERHYQADIDRDDRYALPRKPAQHEEFDCARELAAGQNLISAFTTVYKSPTIQGITRSVKSQAAVLTFGGFGAKFINLSPTPKLLHWDGRGGHTNSAVLIAEIPPMESVGTATTPGQSFSLTPVYDSSHHVGRWTLTADEPIVVFTDDSMQLEKLSPELLMKYEMQQLNLAYARDYLIATGRAWLSHFPRPPPIHKFWPADYLGQVHGVTSRAKHVLGKTQGVGDTGDLHLKLTVTSVAPRVLEMDHFLSDYECRQLINMASQKGLHPSTVVGSAGVDKRTRSSETTWLARSSDKLLDRIYRRAADVFQIDESLLRHTSPHYETEAHHHSIAEDLQVVQYKKGQEYTPHHDFVYPSIAHRHQPTRFATLLLYLHAPEEGGETFFPRSLQTTNHDGLVVEQTAMRGKAILFYNMLPDGNLDDLSQHGSHPVTKGEKWVANLWVWDPIID